MNLGELALGFAVKELGIKEMQGKANTARIIEYEKACDGLEGLYSDSELPWCSAFVNWCVQKAGGKGTRNAMARSWLLWGKKVTAPKKGDLVVFSRGTDNVSGHVAFFISKTDSTVRVLGGNQNDSVSYNTYSLSRVLGFRRSLDG